MFAYIVGKTNGKFEVIKQEDYHLSLEELHKHIDGFFEVVAPMMLANTEWEHVRFLVDDEGLYKDLKVNKVASGLYAGYSPIVGTVLYCTIRPQTIEDEPDIYALPEDEAERLLEWLKRLEKLVHNVKI